jgi:sortase (surface protein transpeptidase)
MNRTTRTSALATAMLAIVLGVVGCGAAASPDPAQSPSPVSHEPAPTKVGKPTRLEIPVIGVDEGLHGVGLNPDGSMHIPDFGDAGWYKLGPRPGAAGPAVLVAHVHGPGGDDVFARLHELQPGDKVTVHRTDGASVFVVEGSEQTPKDALPYDRIWNETDAAVLRLITCGGEYDQQAGGYPDNTIVYARLA